MTKRIILIFILIFTCIYAYPEDITGALNLKQVADDMKYRRGAEFFRLEKYDFALNELYEYLEIYYNGTHRGDAYKKIAEIYIKFYDYQKAADIYKKLYEELSNTEEGLDAYFRAGLCYLKMGFDNKAEAIFQSIIQEHPGTTAAKNAQIQLELIKIFQ